MPYMIRQLTSLSMLALIAGCTQQSASSTPPAFESSRNSELLTPDLYPSGAKQDDSVNVRYGRYTLVNTAPEAEQRDLMAQIIDVNIPGNMHPQVHDAMQYVVDRSGYSLCPPSTEHVNILYTRPLPAAQYKLGPMTLRNTLQVLAGPAWQVKVNEVSRQVCFALRPGYQAPETLKPIVPVPAATAPTVYAVKSPDPVPDSGSQVVVSVPTATAPVITKDPLGQPASGAALPIASAASIPGKNNRPVSDVPPPSAQAKDRPTPSTGTVNASSTATPLAVAPLTTPVATSQAKPAVQSATIQPTKAAVTPPVTIRVAEPVKTPAPVWDAAVGSTLRQTVEAWAKKADWQLIWATADLDYPIEAALQFRGSFADAVTQIFPLYDKARRPFTVDGNVAQRILHISERKTQ